MMSWIQRHAMMVLLRSETASIKTMRPGDVPANLFAYHLEGLKTDKLVEKTKRGTYRLTAQGLKLAGTFSTITNASQENLKTMIMLYGKTSDNKLLLFRWSRQPYIGRVTLAYDRMHFGKSLDDAIRDAVRDKLGSDQARVTFMTNAIIKIEHNGQLISHMNTLVYEVDVSQLNLPFQGRNGEAFLARVDQVTDPLENLAELVQRIETAEQSFEITLRY